MSMLSDLLATWENWSARDTLTRALGNITTDDSRERLAKALDDIPPTDALDALRDSAELVALLTGWQWQAVFAARTDGASWAQIGTAIQQTANQARESYREAIEEQEQKEYGTRDVTKYRDAL